MEAPASGAPQLVTALDASNYLEVLDNVQGLAVVKFWAPWCRTCRGIDPIYERVAQKATQEHTGRVQFFSMNFKENRRACLAERIVMVPTIHFYLRGFGRVNRFVVSPNTAGPAMRRQLARFLADENHMELLQQLEREGRNAVVRYTELVRALNAMSSAPELLSEAEVTEEDAKYQSMVSDERRLRDLELLFSWIDKDGSATIDADEIAAATAALRPGSQSTEEEVAASQALLDRIATASVGEAAPGLPATSGSSLDFASFVRVMTTYEVSNFASPNELLPAFTALDVDEGGTITVDELIGAVENVCKVMPSPDMDGACDQTELLERTFDAFDLDGSGEIDYEEFVSMVSGRGVESPYEA